MASFAISSPTAFQAGQSIGGSISVFWQNPTDPDFSHTELRRSTSNFPLTVLDGDFMTSGTDTAYGDYSATNGDNYYSIFAFDLSGNVSEAATAFVNNDLT